MVNDKVYIASKLKNGFEKYNTGIKNIFLIFFPETRKTQAKGNNPQNKPDEFRSVIFAV